MAVLTRSTVQIIGGGGHFENTKEYSDKVYGLCTGIGGKLDLTPILKLSGEIQYNIDLGGKNYVTGRQWSQRSCNLIVGFQYTFHN